MSVESFYRYVILAHNPYTKSFQYWHSVFERKLLSLRGLVSINNRRHSVSILLINDHNTMYGRQAGYHES